MTIAMSRAIPTPVSVTAVRPHPLPSDRMSLRHDKPLALALLLLATTALDARPANACSPVYNGQTTITASDTPECLSIVGQDFYDDGMGSSTITVSNGCDEPVQVECVSDPNGICSPIEVPAGSVSQMTVLMSGGVVQWTIADESGQATYAVSGDWGGGCPAGPFGCATANRPGKVGSAWLVGLLAAIVGSRRRRQKSV